MKRYRVSNDARRDLDAIFDYWTKRTSLEVAGRLIDSTTERFGLIGENPRCGLACGDIAPGVRCFPAGKYLVYYRKLRQAVEILHVFHGAQDRNRALKKT